MPPRAIVLHPAHAPRAGFGAADRPGWLHEIKFDGWRIIARRATSDLALWSRPERDWTARLACIGRKLRLLLAESFVLDWEAGVLRNDGRADFLAMQGHEDGRLHAFGLLELDGPALRAPTRRSERSRVGALLGAVPRPWRQNRAALIVMRELARSFTHFRQRMLDIGSLPSASDYRETVLWRVPSGGNHRGITGF